MAEQKLTIMPQEKSLTFMQRHPRVARLIRKRSVWLTGAAVLAAKGSEFFTFGKWIVDHLSRIEFLQKYAPKLIDAMYWLVSPRGANALFFLALTAFVVALILAVNPKEEPKAKVSPPQLEESPQPESSNEDIAKRVEELEREKAALVEARDNAMRAREAVEKQVGQLEHDVQTHYIRAELNKQLLDKYKWLHEEAERDKSNIGKYVYIIFREVNYEGLDEIEPYIEIDLNIINASVYNIIIDEDIKKGAVYFNAKELNPKQVKLDGSLHSIPRGEREQMFLVIKQWISPDLARRMKNPLPDDKIHFDRLHLTVRAANNSEIAPQRLSLPSSIPLKTKLLSAKQEAEGEREILLTEPQHLTSLYEGLTDIQGQNLTAQFIGKWIEASGIAMSVRSYDNNTHAEVNLQAWVTVNADFIEPRWIRLLGTIRERSGLTLLGQISGITRTAVNLKNCEVRDVTRYD